MRAGPMRHRVLLQSRVETEDDLGQPVFAWADFFTQSADHSVAADVRFVSGLEAVKSDATVGTTKASIRIRYLPGVVSTMRAVYDGQPYNIVQVLPDMTGRRYLDLVAETGANDG